MSALGARKVEQGAAGGLETAALPTRCGPLVRAQRRLVAHPRKKPEEGKGADRICHLLLWASDYPAFRLFDCQRARLVTGLPAWLERPPLPHNRGPAHGLLGLVDRAGYWRPSARPAIEDVKFEIADVPHKTLDQDLVGRARHRAPTDS